MLNQSVQPIDVEYSEVAENTGNLIDFPPVTPRQPRKVAQQPKQVAERVARQPRKVAQQPTYTAAQLAEVAECTRQAWIKDWYRHFANIAPETDLRDGRKYKALCMEMTKSLLTNKQAGMSTAAWVRYIGLPSWGQQRQEQETAVATAAIVPVEVARAEDASALALTNAERLKEFATNLLASSIENLHVAGEAQTANTREAWIASIVADQTAKLIEEQRLRAQITAEFQAQQRAAEAQQLAQRLEDLKGGAQ